MANYSALKAAVQAVVKTNGNQEITGANMQATLLSIIDSLGNGYQFMGVATPSTTPPSSPDYNIAYIAGAGSYTNFGTSVVIPPTNIAIFKYNGSWACEQVTVENGGVFDISAYNNNTTYADLAAALGTNGANVPESVRKGGMSVKFVCSSDNKYVQYRCISDEFTTDVSKWVISDEGVYVENPEFVYAKTDSEGKILYGVKADGDFYFGVGCPTQIQEYVLAHKEEIIEIIATKVDKVSGKGLIQNDVADSIFMIENPEFLSAETDYENKILGGRKKDGTKFENMPFETPSSICESKENIEYVKAIIDENRNVLEGITRKGEKVINLPLVNPTITSMKKDINDINSDIQIKSALCTSKMCVELPKNGADLFIAYNIGDGTEITYWFRKCMANELFTFYRVGYRIVDRIYPDTEKIDSDSSIVLINRTSSDNIGPIRTEYGASGGNHHWPDEESSPLYKTATCVSYDCYIGNRKLQNGDKFYTNEVLVKVVNTLFDGGGAKDDVTLTLTTPLCTETVFYKIIKNSIEVSVNHKYVANPISTEIEWYGGMQSMFDEEEYYATPNGEFIGWHSVERDSFTKGDYPKFNRFLTKSATRQTYQSAYLMPSKLGKHEFINNDSTIYSSSNYNKQYHQLIDYKTIAELGGDYTWTGVYTFFHIPIAENTDYFVYDGVVNGKEVIFIDFANTSYNGSISLPVEYVGRKISVIEKSDSVTLVDSDFVDAEGIQVSVSGSGNIIVQLD